MYCLNFMQWGLLLFLHLMTTYLLKTKHEFWHIHDWLEKNSSITFLFAKKKDLYRQGHRKDHSGWLEKANKPK